MIASTLDPKQALKDYKTPLHAVETREGRAKQEFYYVSHIWVTKELNRIFGPTGWSKKVERGPIWREKEVLVTVSLFVHGAMGTEGEHSAVYEAFGSHTIQTRKDGSDIPGSFGDAHNAAASKGLSKAATRLGIGLDLKEEMKESTRKKLHALGSKLFKSEWDKFRPYFVRVVAPGLTDDRGKPTESSRFLLDIHARFMIATLEGRNGPDWCASVENLANEIRAKSLRHIAKLKKA